MSSKPVAAVDVAAQVEGVGHGGSNQASVGAARQDALVQAQGGNRQAVDHVLEARVSFTGRPTATCRVSATWPLG